MAYPERVCPVCGEAFIPKSKRQIYDKSYCRLKAHRQSHKNSPEVSIAISGMYTEIERNYPMVAYSISQLAKKIGQTMAEEVFLVTYQGIKQGEARGRKERKPRKKSKDLS